jgi:hypothetical protein
MITEVENYHKMKNSLGGLMKEKLITNTKLLGFFALLYFPMLCLEPKSSSFGWIVGLICGMVGQDILKK